MGRRRLVGEKNFTAPSQGGEEQEEETVDDLQRDLSSMYSSYICQMPSLPLAIAHSGLSSNYLVIYFISFKGYRPMLEVFKEVFS
jgi:hypothetical protein